MLQRPPTGARSISALHECTLGTNIEDRTCQHSHIRKAPPSDLSHRCRCVPLLNRQEIHRVDQYPWFHTNLCSLQLFPAEIETFRRTRYIQLEVCDPRCCVTASQNRRPSLTGSHRKRQLRTQCTVRTTRPDARRPVCRTHTCPQLPHRARTSIE
jgi:hypothetical protein